MTSSHDRCGGCGLTCSIDYAIGSDGSVWSLDVPSTVGGGRETRDRRRLIDLSAVHTSTCCQSHGQRIRIDVSVTGVIETCQHLRQTPDKDERRPERAETQSTQIKSRYLVHVEQRKEFMDLLGFDEKLWCGVPVSSAHLIFQLIHSDRRGRQSDAAGLMETHGLQHTHNMT